MQLTRQEIADRLRVTTRTIDRWIKQGKLKSIKVGGVVRITEEEYQKFIGGKK